MWGGGVETGTDGSGGAGVEQQMVMEIGFTICLCERRLDAVVETGRTTVQCAGSGGESVGPLSPVCPGGPHVCAGRSPAEFPTPSSQTPGSYCFSPFGCPARGPNTDRYLHWGHSRSLLLQRSLTEGSQQSATHL